MSRSRLSSYDQLEGFEELSKLLIDCIKKTEGSKVMEALDAGATAFVNDALKLPKPKSRISSEEYTHMVDTFSQSKNKNQIEVGWGKYYGPMVENGTRLISSQPHLKPLFNANNKNYYKIMIDKINL